MNGNKWKMNGNEWKMNGNEWKMEGNDWQKTGVNSTNKQMAHFGSPQGTIYIYSDPIGDRIFFVGNGIYVGIMLDVGQRKKTVVGILVVPPGRSKTGSWNMVLEGQKEY